MKLDLAIRELAEAEAELAEELLTVGERHRADHDVYHVSRTLAKWCRAHVEALAPHAERYGGSVETDVPTSAGGPLRAVREKGAELAGRRSETGLLLLRDLRRVYLVASGVSIDWVVLGQGAQAARDAELLATVTECHPQTLRQVRWANTRIKEAAPQVLTG